MAKQSSSRVTTVAPPGAGIDLLSDFGREQVAMCLDASSAILRGFQSMRTIQQEAASQACARHEAAARRLRGASAAGDLMAIPFELLQSDLLSASRYWQDLAGAALEMQTEVMSCSSHLFDSQAALQSVSAVDTLEVIPGLGNIFPFPLSAAGREPRGS